MGPDGLTTIAALETECATRFGRGHAVALGRGTWALALTLRAIEKRARHRRLALPSFLCQTPLAGLLWAGWQPLFVDVDPATGLVTDDEWLKAADLGADAMMPVHLFGNPADLTFPIRLGRDRNIFVVEDACQAVGAMIGARPCGGFGDAAILSFGHTKTIDAGSGGMLLTDDAELARAARELATRQVYASAHRYGEMANDATRLFYDRKDSLVSREGDPAAALSGTIDPWLDLVPAPWTADADEIARQLPLLPSMAAERRRKFDLYEDLLRTAGIVPLRMGSGAAPWRFCFRVPGIVRARQQALSSALRSQGVHVSNWYLPTHWMAPPPSLGTGTLAGTLQLHAEIFQLWLDPATDDARIRANAAALRGVLAA